MHILELIAHTAMRVYCDTDLGVGHNNHLSPNHQGHDDLSREAGNGKLYLNTEVWLLRRPLNDAPLVYCQPHGSLVHVYLCVSQSQEVSLLHELNCSQTSLPREHHRTSSELEESRHDISVHS